MDIVEKVVCKICEHPVNPEKLSIHSNRCKEATELKYKVISIGAKLTTIINTAYELQNQLNTNAAIQKYIHTLHHIEILDLK